MIVAEIKGGDSASAGELLRLLVNHPDVEEIFICSKQHAGKPVTAVHRGLDGETDLRFCEDVAEDQEIDVVFDCTDKTAIAIHRLTPAADDEGLLVQSIPELERKPLVRGARRAVTVNCVATVVTLATLPLARNLLPTCPTVRAAVSYPDFAVIDQDETVRIYNEAMSSLFLNYRAPLELDLTQTAGTRAAVAKIELETDVDVDTLSRMYEDFYDDHNFTFLIARQPEATDVVNTNKCLINLHKDGNKLTITSAIDAALKGGAGTAVHTMNLLFGLHEKVGLTLKASTY
jgi:N-acetyl-gamma-glutamyl-phosphate reductase